MTLVLGVDGCRAGWCVIALDADRAEIGAPRVYETFEAVLAWPAAVICVDIPIGLLDVPGQRKCDFEARRMLGRGRAPSVFPPPSRRSLSHSDYRAASEVNFQLTGRTLNKQSFNISPKVREVDDAVKPDMQERVREVHPELCFAALNGGTPGTANKRSVAGRIERWEVLRRRLPSLELAPPRASALPDACEPDDFIDALVCAWTAVCVARGRATSIPGEPETDDWVLRMEMWVPG